MSLALRIAANWTDLLYQLQIICLMANLSSNTHTSTKFIIHCFYLCGKPNWWHGGRRCSGFGIGLALKRLWVQLLSIPSCSHTCASVTKQYNLIPTKRRWCSADGKVLVTKGLVSGIAQAICHKLSGISTYELQWWEASRSRSWSWDLVPWSWSWRLLSWSHHCWAQWPKTGRRAPMLYRVPHRYLYINLTD